MTCQLCETHETEHLYILNDNSCICICALCGKVLWEYKINTKDRLLQLVQMLERIKFDNEMKEMEKQR